MGSYKAGTAYFSVDTSCSCISSVRRCPASPPPRPPWPVDRMVLLGLRWV